MELNSFDAWILQQRVLQESDIVPTTDMLAIGKKVSRNRSGKGYEEFAMTIDEFLKLVPAPVIPTPAHDVNLSVFVDATYGNDATAAKYDALKPYKTLLAAENAAVAGDIIVVNPGTYSGASLTKTGISWDFKVGAKVTYSGTLFNYSAGKTFDIKGQGEFTSTGTAVPLVSLSGATGTFTCAKLIKSASYYFIVVSNSSVAEFNITDYVDASFNLAAAFNCESGSELTVNCPEVRYSWVAYWMIGAGARMIANVDRTICYDQVGDPSAFAGCYTAFANGTSNATCEINGMLDTRQTVDATPGINAAVSFWNNGGGSANNKVILNCRKSKIRAKRGVISNDNSSTSAYINGDIENIQTTAAPLASYSNNSKLFINGNYKNLVGPCILGTGNGGQVFMSRGTLISADGSASIDGTGTTVAGTLVYAVYSGASTTAPSGATALLGAADNLIVDVNVQ